jgi:hypothetical protein
MRVLLLAGLAVLTLAACGKSPGERLAEKALSAATGQDVEVSKDGAEVTFKTEKGDMKIAGGHAATLPASYPKKINQPSDSKVENHN